MNRHLFVPAVAITLFATHARADQTSECLAASEKGQALLDEHKLLKGREQFLTCAREACPAAVRKDCADHVAELDKRTPTVVIRAKDKAGQDLVAVKVTSDGVPLTEQLDGHAIPLDPGVHTFRFEAAGSEPLEQKVVLAEGDHDRAVMGNFGGGGGGGGETAPAKKGAPVGAFVVGGAGIVAMGVGGVFYGLAFSQKSSDESPTGCKNVGTPPGCSSSEIDSIKTKLVVGDIVFYTGVAALGVGIIWAVVHYASKGKEAPPPTASFDVAPSALGHGATVGTTIRF